MIKVTQEVDIFEINGEEIEPDEHKIISVNSHWSRDEWVVLAVGGKLYTIFADDLRVAIENAQNTGEE